MCKIHIKRNSCRIQTHTRTRTQSDSQMRGEGNKRLRLKADSHSNVRKICALNFCATFSTFRTRSYVIQKKNIIIFIKWSGNFHSQLATECRYVEWKSKPFDTCYLKRSLYTATVRVQSILTIFHCRKVVFACDGIQFRIHLVGYIFIALINQ